MKHLFLSSLFSLMTLLLLAQRNGSLSLEINYGLQGNFFVRNYNETGGPGPKTYFYNKHFIGSIGGSELKYKLGQKGNLGIAYARSVSSRKISYSGPFNSINLRITDYRVTHTDIFYQLFYERSLRKISPVKAQIGLFYLRMNQQEVELSNYINTISFEERNYKNSKLEEGGAFFGLHYSKKIDTKFELGIKSRVYYLISTNELEAITLTPTLTYTFK